MSASSSVISSKRGVKSEERGSHNTYISWKFLSSLGLLVELIKAKINVRLIVYVVFNLMRKSVK